jgi:hypothetical protein
MAKRNPKTLDGTLQDLYGHVTGLQKDIRTIRDNHIKHLHEDVGKLDKKVDNVIWATLAAAFTTILTLVGLFNLFLD